ncbi:MAG: hypothetical protein GX664_02530 [Bacteroidales bacterium]|nr:hypothetical protein [Bacteroidales bacterium]
MKKLFNKCNVLLSTTLLVTLAACNTTTPMEPFSYQNSVKAVNSNPGNPYLPLWDHNPDGEPRLFEDPDNPGKYRVYIFTSHDVFARGYCGPDIRAWSAPVEDLTAWRNEGAIFSYFVNGQWDTMYAPDVVEVVGKDGNKTYYLYPNNMGNGRGAMVCKSDRPAGPYIAINATEDPAVMKEGSIMGFDPGVFIEYVTDQNDPDYNIGFRAYGFFGFQGSSAVQLDQNTMYSLRPGTEVSSPFIPSGAAFGRRMNIPAASEKIEYKHLFPGEDPKNFGFFEASSIRQVGNKFVVVYSGYYGQEYGLGSSNATLRYAYADNPLGPYKNGGVVVDARSIGLNDDGSALETNYPGHNTHGSLLQINDQWYIFYHRAPRGNMNSRQVMVAPVNITVDQDSVVNGGKVVITGFDPYAPDQKWTVKAANGMEYTGAEVTSEGFLMYGLDPYRYYSAGYACSMTNERSQQDCYDIWDNNMIIGPVNGGDVIGYKYFGFGGLAQAEKGLLPFEGTTPGNNTSFKLFLTPKTSSAFSIEVWMDAPNEILNGQKIAQIDVPAGSANTTTAFSADVAEAVDNLDGKHAIYLIAAGSDQEICDIVGLGFESNSKKIDRPVPPTFTISVDGQAIEIPAMPTKSNNKNGIVDMNIYEISYPVVEGQKVPVVKAKSTDKRLKVVVEPASTLDEYTVVRCDYNGTIKNYVINFAKE